MHANTRRRTVPPRWMLGVRKNIPATRTRHDDGEDLRVFREVSKLSRLAIREYIDHLLEPA